MAELGLEKESLLCFLEGRDKYNNFIVEEKERTDCIDQNTVIGRKIIVLSNFFDSLIKSTKQIIISQQNIITNYRL